MVGEVGAKVKDNLRLTRKGIIWPLSLRARGFKVVDMCTRIFTAIAICWGAVSWGMLTATPAYADCTDPASPGVDWRRCYKDGRDFSNRDLSGAKLRDTSFARAKLEATNFSKVDGYRAKFYTAKMAKAKFDGARLAEADFSKADLEGASFKGTDLRRTRFFGTNLRGADFTGAKLRGADLFTADLSGATWTNGKTVCAEGSIGQCN